jgi:hypothetical protein
MDANTHSREFADGSATVLGDRLRYGGSSALVRVANLPNNPVSMRPKNPKQSKTRTNEITTTLDRQWFAEIVAGRKRIEYREIKPYWTTRLKRVQVPFRLILRNGMTPPVPVVAVRIDRVTSNRRRGVYKLHIGRVLSVATPSLSWRTLNKEFGCGHLKTISRRPIPRSIGPRPCYNMCCE